MSCVRFQPLEANMVPNPNLKPRDTVIGVGETVPDSTLLNQHREEWKLSEQVKKGDVVLCFYPLAFTEVCSAEMRCVNSDSSGGRTKA